MCDFPIDGEGEDIIVFVAVLTLDLPAIVADILPETVPSIGAVVLLEEVVGVNPTVLRTTVDDRFHTIIEQ
jgi:hypothetical protein